MTGFSFSPYVVIMLTAAAVCMIVCVQVWFNRRGNTEAIPLVVLMLASTEWLVTSALGFAGLDPSSKILWAKIEYFGVTTVPLLVLVLCISHAGFKSWLTVRNLLTLLIIPVATMVLVWTNELHGLIWAKYVPYFENGIMFSNKTYGVGFWIYWSYSYLLLLASTVLIIRSFFVTRGVFRWQGLVLVAGILAPWVGNAMYVLHLSPMANLDLTPLAFAFTGAMLSLGIMRWRLFDIRPVAQSVVIAGMADGLVTLDARDRVIDMNQSAERMLQVKRQETIGEPAERVLPVPLSSLAEWHAEDGEKGFEVMLKWGEKEHYCEIKNTPILDKHSVVSGRVVTFHDMTEYKRMERKLHEAELRESRQALDESEAKYHAILEEMGDTYFEVDLDGNFTFANKATCETLGYPRETLIGMNYKAVTALEHVKTVFEAYNQVYREQKMNAIISYSILRKDGQPGFVEVMAALRRDRTGRILGFRCMGRDITERKMAEKKLEKSYETLKKTLDDAIKTMVKIVEMRDPYTAGHQQGVADLATAIAREMKMSDDQVEQIRIAAVVHDIGKIYVPIEILSKPGKLTPIEYDMIRAHAKGGYDIMKGIDFPFSVAQSILQHHERIDGSGYPDGLKGDAILLPAKVLAVADVVEAMASHRPYRAALGVHTALEEIRSNRGRLYDPDVVDACIRLFKENRFVFHAKN